MRDIKFRAWNKLAQKIAMIDMLDFMLDSYRAHAGKFSGSGHLADIELMQFTGLTDKNGKEIYEGDIVKGDLYSAFLMPNNPNPQICRVEYEENMQLSPFHTMVGYDGELWPDSLVDGFEVIGNVYENHDLLE